MKPLEIYCRGRVMHVTFSIEEKGFGMRDFVLIGKNKTSVYVFRKSQMEWGCAYGELDRDIKEAIIDALLLRFDPIATDVFYHKGVRQVVEVRAKKGGIWHFFINNAYRGSMQYDKFLHTFDYHFDGEDGVLTELHMQKYIGMIQRGEIRWRKEDR
ncbi:hypothetical protein [Sphingobacterium suaedae]|uniref:Uncharacterized protein n=1 Tax=Sphingobacterium suaedae TaxID=1686402 RepID=A0ABW5KHB7_9SPHI